MFDGLAEEPNADSEQSSIETKTTNVPGEISSTINHCTGATEASGATTPMRHPNQLAREDVHAQLELSPIFDNTQHNGSAPMGCIEKNNDNWQNLQESQLESAKDWSGFASSEISGEQSREISFEFGETSPIKKMEN